MKCVRCAVLGTLLFGAGLTIASAADDPTDPGRRVFDEHCRTCHGGTGPADSAIGPNLVGVIGRAAGTADTGVHSRAGIESGTVWTRSALRRYLSNPAREMPGTFMPAQVKDPQELDDLLNFLETLR